MVWSFTCFPLSSFCFLSCFHAFPVTVSVGILSAFVCFCWSRFFFSYLVFSPVAFTCLSSFCFSSCNFFPPASCILHHPCCIFIRRFRFPAWFYILERGQNEGKFHDKQLGAGKPSSPSCYYSDNYYCHCGGLVMFLLQACVLPPPAKHQHHHHHCDEYC